MFIQAQNRRNIINTFYVRKFVRTDDNQIHAVLEFATKTKPAVIEVLGEYDSEEKCKAVYKGLMFDMRKREQAFKMPKNHKVNLRPKPKPGQDQAQGQAQAQAQAPDQAQAQAAAPEAPAPDQAQAQTSAPAPETPTPEAPEKE